METTNSGATAPAETFPGMLWLDTSAGASPSGVLRLRNSANTAWILLLDSASLPPTDAGGAFTGAITINANPALLTLNKTAQAGASIILGSSLGLGRWDIIPGDSAPESGANAGSNFEIRRYSDAGAPIDSPVQITRTNGRVTLSGGLSNSDGSTGAPSYSFGGEPNTGLYRSSAGTIAIACNGALAAYVNAAVFALNMQLVMSAAAPAVRIGKLASGQECDIVTSMAGTPRWNLSLGDGAAETGGNNGSNLSLVRYTDGGVPMDTVFSINRASGQAQFTGPLSLSIASHATLTLNKMVAGVEAMLIGSQNGVPRWVVNVASSTAEGGGNTGANFAIQSYTDAGALMAAPLTITRSNSHALFTSAVGFGGDQTWQTWLDIGLRRFDFATASGFSWNTSNGAIGVWLGGATIAYWTAGGFTLVPDAAQKLNAGPWSGVSDERLKENIADYTAGLAQVIALRPRTFTFKPGENIDPTVTHYGLISQEAEPVMPELISVVTVDPEPPPDPQGRGTNPARSEWAVLRPMLGMPRAEGDPVDILFLNPTALTYALCNAVRELNAKVDAYVAAHP